ncbi:MAG TPA: hypothetical protein VGZ02_01330 [Candidatus Baltobacteraceae bacterium]|jgi:hypothetical protein|nr:hypothetical protein [Candidatus Baltobacteraceae bacterium]
MFYFVEFLRAKRALRVIFIILGVITVAAICLRVYLFTAHGPEDVVQSLRQSPTAHVNDRRLADGTLETTVDDPARSTHAVIRQHGDEISIDVTEPMADYRKQTDHLVTLGNDHEDYTVKAGLTHGTMRFKEGDGKFDLSGVFGIAGIMALVTATMLGAPLAKENDGHLDLAWTKPVSRDASALAAFGVDIAAIVASQLVTVAAILIWVLFFIVPAVTLSSFAVIFLSMITPVAWYAMLTAFSSSLKRGPGLVIGLSWPAALIVSGVAHGTHGAVSPIAHAIHVFFQVLAYIDPLAYADFSNGDWHGNGAIHTISSTIIVLCLLAVLYLASAVLQWRRVEA